MATPKVGPEGMRIALQVGSELRITSRGDVVMGNPEIEVAEDQSAADAMLLYRFEPETGDHILKLLEPVADHAHQKVHRRDD